jgi:hypothetical protein
MAVTKEYRGQVTVVGRGANTGAKRRWQDGEAIGFDDFTGGLKVAFAEDHGGALPGHSTPQKSHTAMVWPAGAKVLAQWKGKGKHFPAKIMAANADATFSVLYDDGDKDPAVVGASIDDRGVDYFKPGALKLPAAGVPLLDGDTAAALLRQCIGSSVADAFCCTFLTGTGRLHPVRRGASLLYAVDDLCQAYGINSSSAALQGARAFATSLSPGQRHEASAEETGVLQDQGLLEASVAVSCRYRGPVRVIGGGDESGGAYVGQIGQPIGDDGASLKVEFDDGTVDSFASDRLLVQHDAVLLLDAAGAEALLRSWETQRRTVWWSRSRCCRSVRRICRRRRGTGRCRAASAFQAFLVGAGNPGLYQAAHLSLQESECAEAFRDAALSPKQRPQRAEGLFKWFNSKAEATAILNDFWYLGTLRLVRPPASPEEQLALGRALFPAEDDKCVDELHIGGFAEGALKDTGCQALLSLVCAVGGAVGGLDFGGADQGAFADGEAGVLSLAWALQSRACLQLQLLSIQGSQAGPAGVAALGDALRSGVCPQLLSLNIRDSAAGAVGGAAVGGALRAGACLQLQTLNMRGNDAGAAGAGAVAEALGDGGCPQLQLLNIQFNNAGAAVVASLGEALRAGMCPQMRTLIVNGNNTGAVAVASLGEALRSGVCPQLKLLSIAWNGAKKADLGDLAALEAACHPELSIFNSSDG